MLAKTLKRAGIGFLLGIVIGYALSILTGLDNPDVFISVPPRLLSLTGSVPLSQILQGLFSGIYGAVCFGTMTFYEIERWPLALATGAHCAVIVLLYIPVGFFLGWLDGWLDMLIVAGCQLVGFFIIWLIMNAIYKKQVKELNEMQKDFSERQK
ncbi:MAG: DUF3021 domain-containing protein [Ruminococcus sp.]|nr:DUF3021 domain-containing protein [Ruminococcus sp.]